MSIDKLDKGNCIDGPHELYLPSVSSFWKRDNGSPSYIEVRIVDLGPVYKIGGYVQVPFIFSPSACLFSQAEGGERKSYGGRTAKGQHVIRIWLHAMERRKRSAVGNAARPLYSRKLLILEDMERIFRIWGLTMKSTVRDVA